MTSPIYIFWSVHCTSMGILLLATGANSMTWEYPDASSTSCETIASPVCDQRGKYRQLDGTCNNMQHPTWGAANTVLRRMLPAEYEDGMSKPKRSRLPSPRVISNKMKESTPQPQDSSVSHLHALYGQLLAHDITHTPMVKASTGKDLDCNCESPAYECVNIPLSLDDALRMFGRKKCINLPRSKAAISQNRCTFRYREQTNTMSSFIDGTFMYGRSDEEANDLRDRASKSGELLLIKNRNDAKFKNLPKQSDVPGSAVSSATQCNAKVKRPADSPCPVAGDGRVGENAGLIAIQTAFARYHNMLSRGLKNQNPQWNSEKVYFETRKIVSAIIQSITYREYLPPLVGPIFMKRFGLTLTDYGYWNGYDSRYDPSITNEFATAAFRYGHSQVSGMMSRPTAFFNVHKISPMMTNQSFFNSKPFTEKGGGGAGALLRGFMIDNAEKTDTDFVNAIRNQLMAPRGSAHGMDLFAINIQRGRDHGLPGYNKYREFCGYKRALSFTDLLDEIPRHVVRRLQSIYDTVDDIDLYVGGLAENHVKGGVVGPTFACILSYTMRNLRKGDRLWHEIGDETHSFTVSQLRAIRKVSLANILCETGEDMKYVPRTPLQMKGGKLDGLMNCGNVDKLDLTQWNIRAADSTGHIYPIHSNVGWTAWFVTGSRRVITVNANTELSRVRATRPDDVCGKFVNYELRYTTRNEPVQIRFSCHTNRRTDFPFQASDRTKWTDWIESQSIGSGGFPCRDIIAIQAKTTDGESFASETGDVFYKFGSDGFACRDRDQISGTMCHRYKVRALCRRENNYDIPSTTRPTSMPNVYSTAPYPVKDLSKKLCHDYGICCDEPGIYYIGPVPLTVIDTAKQYCKNYNKCCDF